jgi:hypothetical protein
MRNAILVLFALAVSSCGGSAESENEVAGPCSINFTEPVFVISDVRSSTTGARLSTVSIQSISLDGVAYDLSIRRPVILNAAVQGSSVQCTVSCGFAVEEGLYAFTVTADGFRAKAVEVRAQYSSFRGNCPATFSGSTAVSVMLEPN